MTRGHFVAWGALLACAAWLLSPALHPVHVEGFSAAVVALGAHVADGSVGAFFPAQALNTDYFGLTKLGAVLGVAGLVELGLNTDAAIRVLMGLGGVLLVAGSARLIRRWSGASWWVVAAVLLLMPGVAESAFFVNDNLLGAGLLIAGFAMLTIRDGVGAALLTGALIGAAVTVRTDLILVAPALLLIVWEDRPFRRALLLTGVAGAAALAVWIAAYAAVGATPLDAVRVGQVAVALWERPFDLGRQLAMLLLFLGPAAIVLLLLGLRGVFGGGWRRAALLLGVPLFVNLALAGKIWEVRQLLPLTPFLGAVVAMGARGLIADWRDGRRVMPAVVAVAIAAVLLVPPPFIATADGPRAPIGRVAAMAYWRDWQAGVRRDFATIDQAIAAAAPGAPVTIVATYWSEDRYLHLRLWDAGFRPVGQPPACAPVAQTFVRDGRIVRHVTLHQTFLAGADTLDRPRLAQLLLPCLRTLPGAVILLGTPPSMRRLIPDPARFGPAERIVAVTVPRAILERVAAGTAPDPRVAQAAARTGAITAFGR